MGLRLEIVIILLLGIAFLIFVLTSLPFLTRTSEAINSPNKALFSNIFLFLLCFSTVLFFYSIYQSDDGIVEFVKPSFLKSRKGTC